ncbi:MAG: hypothetical protein EA400_16055 [Chromatiaceae bacterium]|nr:MAG: hypothetical protein EA400_16055 [Chromatiaceae bacterium]
MRGPRTWLLVLFLLLTLIGLVAVNWVESDNGSLCLRSSQVQMQFATDPVVVRKLLGCWGEAGRAAVLRGIHVDFLLILGYAPLLFLLVLRASREHAGHGRLWRPLGLLLALAPLLAGGLDVIENLWLLRIIGERATDIAPERLILLTQVKWGLVALALAYLLVALLTWYARPPRPLGETGP